MKYVAILALALGLTACHNSTTPEDQVNSLKIVNSNLPAGCSVKYAGNVKIQGSARESRIFVTTCDTVTTVSESHSVKQGKTSYLQTDVNIIKN